MLKTFALVIVLNTSATQWTETTVATGMTEAACLSAMRAVWATEHETVGYDASGAIPAVDAWCRDESQPYDAGDVPALS